MTENSSARGAMRLGGLCLDSRHREEQSDVAVSAPTPVIAMSEATWRCHRRHCHPEQRDCLRPLAGRIYSLSIRFFAEEAQNDKEFVIARSETTWRSQLRHCHPEQRDCLRPLAGRIYSLIIRFFAKEAQNDKEFIRRTIRLATRLTLPPGSPQGF